MNEKSATNISENRLCPTPVLLHIAIGYIYIIHLLIHGMTE